MPRFADAFLFLLAAVWATAAALDTGLGREATLARKQACCRSNHSVFMRNSDQCVVFTDPKAVGTRCLLENNCEAAGPSFSLPISVVLKSGKCYNIPRSQWTDQRRIGN